MIQRVGFIGLGNIGAPMARNLCGGTFEVIVFDLQEEAMAPLLEAGAKAAASAREVGERSEMVGVCVVDDAATFAVVAGEDGILAGAAAGTIIALHGTIHPDTARRLGEQAAASGVAVVDAQMTGGPRGAEARQLRYMVGGDAQVLERCRPVLETSAAEITHCGALGMGAVAKLCNNLAQYVAWQGFVEADRLARHAGLDPEILLQVLSWLMNDNARLMLAGRNALEAAPDNEFLGSRMGAAMRLAEKDLSLALDVARWVEVSLPGAGLCAQEAARLFGVPDPGRR
ncbi:MAG: NAD(P)-dependent oxidoreductase [Myxococcota bacterium]